MRLLWMQNLFSEKQNVHSEGLRLIDNPSDTSTIVGISLTCPWLDTQLEGLEVINSLLSLQGDDYLPAGTIILAY